MIDLPEHIQSLQPYQPGKPITELMREQGLSILRRAAEKRTLTREEGQAFQCYPQQG